MRPAEAHRVTVFGSTLNIKATSPGVSSRSWFSTIMISSSGRNSSCQRSRQVRRRGGIRPALVPRLLSVCSGKTAALNGLVGLLVPFA